MSLQTQPVTRNIIRHGGPYKKVGIKFAKKGRTKQSFEDECNINLIVAKHTRTGAIAHVNKHQAEYGFATSDDFSTAMRTVTQAQEMFNGLPSAIRNRFANSPGQFLDFVQDANNKDEGQRLGLWKPDGTAASTAPEDQPKKQPESQPAEKTDNETTKE